MHERDAHVMRAGPRHIVDHAAATLLQLGDAGLDVVDRERDVVQTFAALFEEGGDRAARIGGLEELQADVPDAEEADAHLLIGTLFGSFEDGAEDAFVEGSLVFDRADRDADMVDGFDRRHGSLLSLYSNSTPTWPPA